MTDTNAHDIRSTTSQAQFLAPQTHQRAAEEEATGAKVCGFGFEWGGRLYDRAQIVSACGVRSLFSRRTRAPVRVLGLASQSVQWADLDNAFDHSTDALSDGHRERIDAECVAQYHGVEMNGKGIVVQTNNADGELEVTSANIGEEYMQLLLESCGTLYVKNQDGVDLILYFDMDQETLVVEIDGNEG